jgi:hypothetical protein
MYMYMYMYPQNTHIAIYYIFKHVFIKYLSPLKNHNLIIQDTL